MDDSLLGHQIAIAALISGAIELLKRSPFPWFSQHSDQLNRSASLLAAALTAVGLTAQLKGSLETGGMITIMFPSLNAMIEAALHFASQAMMQEAIYRMALKPKPAT